MVQSGSFPNSLKSCEISFKAAEKTLFKRVENTFSKAVSQTGTQLWKLFILKEVIH